MKNTTVSNIEKFPVPEYPPTWEKKKKRKGRREQGRQKRILAVLSCFCSHSISFNNFA